MLQYPLKDIFVTQYFGENPDFYIKNYGVKGHNGIDYRAPTGTPVYATHDGFAYYEKDSAGGEGVVIRSKGMMLIAGQLSHFKTIYWHLDNRPGFKSPITCTDVQSQGQVVKCGDLIGYADSTGVSFGSHLHFGLKPIALTGTAHEEYNFYNTNQNNGYAGAIDPMPYLPKKYQFLKNMEYGNRSADVAQLQQRLINMGYNLPSGATGFYGNETKAAVFIFQSLYVPMSWTERYVYKGKYCGAKTRAKLNST